MFFIIACKMLCICLCLGKTKFMQFEKGLKTEKGLRTTKLKSSFLNYIFVPFIMPSPYSGNSMLPTLGPFNEANDSLM